VSLWIRLVLVACATLLNACAFGDVHDDASLHFQTDHTGDGRGGAVGPTSTPASTARSSATPVLLPLRTTVRVADRLRQFLARVLDAPSAGGGLYRHVRRVSVGLQVAAIHTDLSSDELDRATAEQIGLVASWFKQSPEGRHVTALDVEVYGEAGDLIAAYDDAPALASASSRSRARPPDGIPAVHVVPSPAPRQAPLDSGREPS
jgi:hypothetical protein